MLTEEQVVVGQRIRNIFTFTTVCGNGPAEEHPHYPQYGKLATITEKTPNGFKYDYDEPIYLRSDTCYQRGCECYEIGYKSWEVYKVEPLFPGILPYLTTSELEEIIDMKEPSLSRQPTQEEIKEADELMQAYKEGKELSIDDLIKIELAGRLDNTVKTADLLEYDQIINVSALLREIEAAGEPNQVCMDKVYAGAIVLLRLMRESGLPKMDLISKLVNDL